MMFESRENAANLLLKKLKQYKDKDVIVAGIPQGGMPIAKILADGLDSELTAVLVHKLPSPYGEELPMGCIGISGHISFLPHAEALEASSSYIDLKSKEQIQKLKRRQEKYSLSRPNFEDSIVILVDDGIATGATMLCAVHEVRSYSPRKIVLVAPVSSPDAAKHLRPLVDDFITLYIPLSMSGIGQFYRDFPPVEDEQVIELLHRTGGVNENHAY